MNKSQLSVEEARALAENKGWSIEALLEKLPHVRPTWMRDAVEHFKGNHAELHDRLFEVMQQQQGDAARTYVACVLAYLGDPRGKQVFLANLASADAAARKLAWEQLPCNARDFEARCAAPFTTDEVCAAVLPFLDRPETVEGRRALNFALQWSFDLTRKHVGKLLQHTDMKVRLSVLCAYLRHGLDEGALDVLSADFLASAPLSRPKSDVWSGILELGPAVSYAVRQSHDSDYRSRLGTLSLRLLQQTVQMPNAAALWELGTRWPAHCGPWFETVSMVVPAGAAEWTLSVIQDRGCHAELRACAAICGQRICAVPAALAGAFIAEILSKPTAGCGKWVLRSLLECGFATLQDVRAGLRSPYWSAEVLSMLQSRDIQIDRAALANVLSELIEQDSLPSTAQRLAVIQYLHSLPRSADDDARILQALRWKLTGDPQDADTLIVANLLTLYGHTDQITHDVIDKMDAWVACTAYWAQSGIDPPTVANLLAQALVIDPVGSERLQSIDPQGSAIDILMNLLLGPEEADWRGVVTHIRDDGFDPQHQELFGQLAGIVRPKIVLDALSQSNETRLVALPEASKEGLQTLVDGEWSVTDPALLQGIPMCRSEGQAVVRFVYADRVFEYRLSPGGTWMDARGVLDAFNGFMRELGRRERAIQLDNPFGNHEWPLFITADPDRFAEINAVLRLPIDARPT